MEKEFSETVLNILAKDFYIQTEVWGTHFSGTKLRIDAVAMPKESTKWKNPDVCFGIEFKAKQNLKDTTHKTHWINQCIDYANTNWDKFGYMYIFSCPSVFENLGDVIKGEPWLWNRILSNQGVGRLDFNKYHGLTFYLQDTHRIWSEKGGVASGKVWSLKRKFGRGATYKHY